MIAFRAAVKKLEWSAGQWWAVVNIVDPRMNCDTVLARDVVMVIDETTAETLVKHGGGYLSGSIQLT